jgi:hypothetical protein
MDSPERLRQYQILTCYREIETMSTFNQSGAQAIGLLTFGTEPARAFLKGILLVAGLAVAVAAPAWADTNGAVHPQPAALEKWRAVMAENPPQEAGCFRESYPSLVREKVDCHAAPPQGFHSTSRRPPSNAPGKLSIADEMEAGGTIDYVAETKGKTFWAGGNFLDVSVKSEASVGVQSYGDQGVLGSNDYTLQINTNNLETTSACNGGTTFDCRVWQQFVYSSNCDMSGCDDGAVFIQYWLINAGYCPQNQGWTQQGNDCVKDSGIAGAPDFPITELAKLSLHAAAHAGGQDCAVVYDDTGAGWGVCADDSVLDISSVWNKTEFGIFGDGGGSQAQFGNNTSFAVLLQVNDGSGLAPKCVSDDGTTGETNNLTLSKTCEALVGNGLYPRIRFTESNPFKAPPLPSLCGQIFPGQGLTPGHVWSSCDELFTLDMQTDGNLVLYQGPLREEPTALWSTGTSGQHAAFVIMQEDGNLVLYNTSEAAIWNSGTPGYEGASLAIQDDGNLVIYYPGGGAIWDSGTCCH